MRTAFAVVGCVLFVAYILVHVAGCGGSHKEVAHAAALSCGTKAVAVYDRELAECQAHGLDAGTFTVYELCAQSADVRFRYAHALCARKDGGA